MVTNRSWDLADLEDFNIGGKENSTIIRSKKEKPTAPGVLANHPGARPIVGNFYTLEKIIPYTV